MNASADPSPMLIRSSSASHPAVISGEVRLSGRIPVRRSPFSVGNSAFPDFLT